MKDEYDVAIVGAGPAGTYASRRMAEKGLSVLCIDKREEIGYPVRCGEGLMVKHLEEFNIPLDGKYIAATSYGVSIYLPDGSVRKVKDKKDTKRL